MVAWGLHNRASMNERLFRRISAIIIIYAFLDAIGNEMFHTNRTNKLLKGGNFSFNWSWGYEFKRTF